MSQAPADLELIVLTLIDARMERGDEVFVFTHGMLRGKLKAAAYSERCLPSSTYLKGARSLELQKEPCLRLSFMPGPRNRMAATDTPGTPDRAQIFNIPARLVNDAVFLHKVEEGVWMLNVNTRVKD